MVGIMPIVILPSEEGRFFDPKVYKQTPSHTSMRGNPVSEKYLSTDLIPSYRED